MTSGHGAGARAGDWIVQEVSLKDIVDDRIEVDGLNTIRIECNRRTERHLLQPYDVLVTARSTIVKSAVVPPSLSQAVANSTLAVVRSPDPELNLFLWWFFTSRYGRAQLEARMVGSTVRLLRAAALEELMVPVPDRRRVHLIADIIEASEQAYQAAVAAAQIRHSTIRDHVIEELLDERGERRYPDATH